MGRDELFELLEPVRDQDEPSQRWWLVFLDHQEAAFAGEMVVGVPDSVAETSREEHARRRKLEIGAVLDINRKDAISVSIEQSRS